MLKREEIRIRDPFILAENETYYMYGTTDLEDGYKSKNRFSVYVSKDLKTFEGPFVVFDGSAHNFWATHDYWAAEVWKNNGKYYLFGSFKSDTHRRATQILEGQSPLGPFYPISEKPHTPEDWECLDGTFYEEDGIPYMVFCHEWVQCGDGEICAVQLSQDLCNTVGKPFLLFKASENPFVTVREGPASKKSRITDGPFLFRNDDKLTMIWSSISNGKYAVLEATANGIKEKWTHDKSRFDFDGGHAMIFTDFNGAKYFALHRPNCPDQERAVFIPYQERRI